MQSKKASVLLIFMIIIFSCDSKKKVAESSVEKQTEIVNTNTDLALAGNVNFEDEESLTIYSAILKNVIGDKAGAYIGHTMDKLASEIDEKLEYTELLRAGEGLILEFNTDSNLYFDSGKTSLNNSSKEVLSKIHKVLESFPNVNVIVETHTDNSGDEAVNLTMTTERVNSIKSFFLESGLKEERLKVKAFGESQPKFENNSEKDRMKNRRVEFGFYASQELKNDAKKITD